MQTRRPHSAPTGTLPISNQACRGRHARRRSRHGVILLLVVSLLALFLLLGVSFSLVALQSLNASKLDIKISQLGDLPDTEMDLVLGQILYDTQARTVLQYHSLLRDLYGYDENHTIFPYSGNPGGGTTNVPQFRETFTGALITRLNLPDNVTLPIAIPAGNSGMLIAGGQLFTFIFALPSRANAPNPNGFPFPLPGTNWSFVSPYLPVKADTYLSKSPNYYTGRSW